MHLDSIIKSIMVKQITAAIDDKEFDFNEKTGNSREEIKRNFTKRKKKIMFH